MSVIDREKIDRSGWTDKEKIIDIEARTKMIMIEAHMLIISLIHDNSHVSEETLASIAEHSGFDEADLVMAAITKAHSQETTMYKTEFPGHPVPPKEDLIQEHLELNKKFRDLIKSKNLIS